MPSAPTHGQHFGGTHIREDLTDIIFQITPTDTPVLNITPRGTAKGVTHEWQKRALTTRQDNAQVEGAVYDFDEANRRPSRVTNITQNFLKQVRVSSTVEAAESAGIASMFADQTEVATVELKTDMEHAVIQGTLASGATGTARRMKGLIEAIEDAGTTATNSSGVVSFTETHLNDFIQACWDEGGAPRDWFCQGEIKRRISGFTASSTSYRDQASGRVVNTVSVYESDFFVIETHLSRDIPNTNNTSRAILGLDRSMLSLDLLRPVMLERTAKVASSTDGVVETECCISWGNELGHFYAKNIK